MRSLMRQNKLQEERAEIKALKESVATLETQEKIILNDCGALTAST